MTTYSRSDLVTRIARDLGLIAAEETPSASDYDFISETVESVYGELALRGIELPNGSDQVIPSNIFVALSKRIGLDVATGFGMMAMKDAEVAKPALEIPLRVASTVPATGATAESHYF